MKGKTDMKNELEEELSKSVEEMNVEVINTFIDELEIEPPTKEEKKADWKAIMDRLRANDG